MLKIMLKACSVTVAVVAVSQVVSFATRYAAGQPFTLFVFLMNSILPVLTAFPAGLYVFWQTARLKRALAELRELHVKLEAKANRDQMTGFLNREAFFEQFKMARRWTDTGALALIDADHFKKINDTYGHLVGDEALKLIAGAIDRTTRELDIVGRIGGEEFCVFLPAASRDDAVQIAERIRVEVERLVFQPDDGKHYPLTISIGVALTRGHHLTSQLMRQADRCLYDAKGRGRNTVVVEDALAEMAERKTSETG
ncbi:GGDEF domain-containing protein [Aminobacter sp. P9b]|uniref:GGDEF domain-containing protein n=1 Tax=Aminobacter sp. P9b TaxID=3133697 RepID=UPI00324CFC8B